MFDNVAAIWTSSIQGLPLNYIDLLMNNFPDGKCDWIADLGCGNGTLTFLLSKIGKNVIGIDASSEMIELAKQKDVEKRIEWIRSSVQEYGFGD